MGWSFFIAGRSIGQSKKGVDSRRSYACFSAPAQSPDRAFLMIGWSAL